jgi:signal recognition particle subunit SRP54
MFDTLSERLGSVFDQLTGRGALSEKDVDSALREVRIALLEADVALPVVKDALTKIRHAAVGEDVIRSVKPGQQVIKIVHDALVEMLGGDMSTGLELNVSPPAIVMMAGLQGAGKTTLAGKLALRLRKEKKRVLLASLDTRRPAAMLQLQTLAKQAEVDFLPIIEGQTAIAIARRALQAAKLGGQDVVILDTAGRTSIDEDLMSEARSIADETRPHEIILVADALTGQDAVETARRFHARLPLTGLALTRIDGDGRGGAALSMRQVTGLPIKVLGTGEKLADLELFDPRRIAGRILGQGDVVSLVEKAAAEVDQVKAEKMARKMAKGQFDLNDLAEQFRMLDRMGGMGGLMGLLPGMGKMKGQIEGLDSENKLLKRQEAIILSMTAKERTNPDLIKASRKKRIAAGAGMDVADVNKLLKMHRQMADMMKKVGKGGMKNMARSLGNMGGGLPPGMGGMPAGMGMMGKGLPGLSGGAPKSLPGLGGSVDPRTGLPGLTGKPKK